MPTLHRQNRRQASQENQKGVLPMSNKTLDSMPVEFKGALFTPIKGESGMYIDKYGIRYTLTQVEVHRAEANRLMNRAMRHERNQPYQQPRTPATAG
jgi:hypothetical protein